MFMFQDPFQPFISELNSLCLFLLQPTKLVVSMTVFPRASLADGCLLVCESVNCDSVFRLLLPSPKWHCLFSRKKELELNPRKPVFRATLLDQKINPVYTTVSSAPCWTSMTPPALPCMTHRKQQRRATPEWHLDPSWHSALFVSEHFDWKCCARSAQRRRHVLSVLWPWYFQVNTKKCQHHQVNTFKHCVHSDAQSEILAPAIEPVLFLWEDNNGCTQSSHGQKWVNIGCAHPGRFALILLLFGRKVFLSWPWTSQIRNVACAHERNRTCWGQIQSDMFACSSSIN